MIRGELLQSRKSHYVPGDMASAWDTHNIIDYKVMNPIWRSIKHSYSSPQLDCIFCHCINHTVLLSINVESSNILVFSFETFAFINDISHWANTCMFDIDMDPNL